MNHPGFDLADEKTDEDFHQNVLLPLTFPQFHGRDICSAKGFEKSRKYFTELPFPPFFTRSTPTRIALLLIATRPDIDHLRAY